MGSEKIKMELLQSKIVGGGGGGRGAGEEELCEARKAGSARREEHLLGHRALRKLHKQIEEEEGDGERGQRKGSDQRQERAQ